MKPDWKDAPEWANWKAMDEDGEWWWYEEEPYIFYNYWVVRPGRRARAGYIQWRDTLEARPK